MANIALDNWVRFGDPIAVEKVIINYWNSLGRNLALAIRGLAFCP